MLDDVDEKCDDVCVESGNEVVLGGGVEMNGAADPP